MQNLTLEYFRGNKFPFYINRGVAIFQIKHLLEGGRNYKLDFDVYLPTKKTNLQRPLVWTLLQKRELIVSLFKGHKLPPLTIIQKEKESEISFQVIDGKQRLTTLISFCQNQFSLDIEGIEFYFSDLPNNLQKEILWYYPVIDVGYEYADEPITDDDKIRWFELINFSGAPQDKQHLLNLKNGSTII